VETFGATVTQACRLAGLSRTAWYRHSRAKDQTALRMRIREIARDRPRYGATRIGVLLRREGWRVNKKRVHRLYCLEGLQVRMRVKRRKHMALHRGPAPVPTGRGQRWSMDFVHDALIDGRAFRVLTVVDQWSRESPLVEVQCGLSGRDVVRAFEARVPPARLPKSITVDHGQAHGQWAHRVVQRTVTR
jgi:putative transposase